MTLDGIGKLVTCRVQCGGDGTGERRECDRILEHAVHIEAEHIAAPECATVRHNLDVLRCLSDAVSDLVARYPTFSEP
jgi:hypothetical protein